MLRYFVWWDCINVWDNRLKVSAEGNKKGL